MKVVCVYQHIDDSFSGIHLKTLFCVCRSVTEACQLICNGHSSELFASYTLVYEELSEQNVLNVLSRKLR